jgi:pilus assembly protein CpaC
MFTHSRRRQLALHLSLAATIVGFGAPAAPLAAQDISSPSIVHRVQTANERLEMTVNSSRLLTLDLKIPRAQVNNKDVVDLTALSPNVIQVFAKKAGITQVNLWDEKNQIHSIDVVVYGDARELSLVLQQQFPNATVNVRPSANSVILSGFVPEPDQAAQIQMIAQDYYPKVVNLLKVGGVQQILLHVKVLEVSRTKLRDLGFDFWTNNKSFFLSSTVSGLAVPNASPSGVFGPTGLETARFGIVNDNSAFFGLVDALRRNQLAKIMAEPTLVTVSGRPAFFNSGGEFPILIPAGLGTVSIDYKKFGTQVDFVPIVLGNGNIRLEVKPRVSFVDPTLSVTAQGITVPGLNVREVDTGVEMKPGQTLAIAGLMQVRTDATQSGIPYLADLPYVGAAFRKTHEETNEIELVVLVTPEIVDAMDPCDVPPCMPGMASRSPDDCEFYWKGHIEVPSCGPCAASDCLWGGEGRMGAGPEPVPAPGSANGGKPPAATGASSSNVPRTSNRPASSNLTYPPSVAQGASGPYNRPKSQNPRPNSAAAQGPAEPSLIGPVGYEVLK